MTALDEHCPHQGASLAAGDVAGDRIVCIAHHWEFELATGRCTIGTADLPRYPARIAGGRVLVELPR